MEVIRATDIGVGDRRLVRDAGARFAIETILENGLQRCVGMGIDLQGTTTSSIQAIAPEGLGQSQHSQATAISLLRVPPLAHDHIDKGFDIWADQHGLSPDALWCPVFTEPMMCGHVVTVGGVLAVA